MAKGKKKSKGRKRVLDPVALEKKRIEEADQRRRQLAMLKTRLAELMEEERKMSTTASSAIESRWIALLRESKHKQLVSEIEVLKRKFENTVDRKDAAISILLNDLEEAEEQYRLAFRSHVEVVDSLIALQSSNADELQAEFERDLLTMRQDFEAERMALERNHETEMANLKLILQNMEAEAHLMDKKLQEDSSEAHETAAERMEEEKKQMQAELLRISESIRSELDSRYKEFMATAQVNMKDYMDKSKEDEETTQRIAAQLKKIDKLQETVALWRTNISRNAREWDQRNNAIRSERDATLMHLKRLKTQMQGWRKKQSRRMANLATEAKAAEDQLTDLAGRAQRILRLVELCRPLETERERVLAHEANVSPGEIEDDVRNRMAAAEAQVDVTNGGAKDVLQTSEDWELLDRFLTKHNKVVFDNAAIAQEQRHLEEENRQLQRILKQYLDDVSVNDSVMQSRNALLQTKTALNVVQAANAAGTADRQHMYNTVVEGNKVVSDLARQGVQR